MTIVNRERRKNAGKRMAILGKKLAEEDDAFWSHETWVDEEDSCNESFHESDEDSALQKDIFDSDFNDSESENDDEDVAAGEAEERELRKRERSEQRQRKKSTNFLTSGGQKRRRGFPGGRKRVIGEGFNAGIVLSLPPESIDSLSYLASISAKRSALQEVPMKQECATKKSADTTAIEIKTESTHCDVNILDQTEPLPSLAATITSTAFEKKTKEKPVPLRKQTRASRLSARECRSTYAGRKLREAPSRRESSTGHTSSCIPSSKVGSHVVSRTSVPMKRKRYSQEELLLEAIHETEPENQRWLYGRKRVQDQYDRDKDLNAGGSREKYRGKKVVQKFHSRRGCLITLTFPEMDSVPEILMRRQQSIKQQTQAIPDEQGLKSSSSSKVPLQEHGSSRCVITGKIGRYKDPLTNYTYHDHTAFKELRRRWKEGEAIVKKSFVKSTTKTKCNDDDIGSVRKMPFVIAEGASFDRTKVSEGVNHQPYSNTADKSDEDKTTVTPKKKALEKLSSSAIDVLLKLPFQSPKPLAKVTVNGNSSTARTAGGSKVRPCHGNASETNQELDSIKKLAFSWDSKPSSSAKTTNPSSTKITDSPLSASGRRLSPRKRKPSENILETIAMLPGKDKGGIAVVPPGLGIQHLSTSFFPDHLSFGKDHGTNTIDNTSVRADQLSSMASTISIIPRPAPANDFLLSKTKDNNHTGKILSTGLDSNGGSMISGHSNQNWFNDTHKGLKTTATTEVVNHQKLINEITSTNQIDGKLKDKRSQKVIK